MTIKLLNQESELHSFPSTQSILLLSDKSVEETKLDSTIILFRLQTENQLVNLAEPYSYNLGTIKETFDTVSLKFEVEEKADGYHITCTPVKPLLLDSKYCLYITNQLSEKYINITKSNSKSTSNIRVKDLSPAPYSKEYNLTILETSTLSLNRNLVKLTIDNVSQTINLKNKTKILFDNIEIHLDDTIYNKDESFNISIVGSQESGVDFQYVIKTVLSASITPIETKEASTSISNQTILDYYKNINTNPVKQRISLIPKYLSINVFSVKIPEGYTIDVTSPDFKSTISVAFNNYLLSNLNLYQSDKKYIVILRFDEFENELVFETIYSTDKNQVDLVVIDLTQLEII